MKIKLGTLFLFIFSLLFFLFPLKNTLAASTLSGTVQDTSGISVGGATVHVYTAGTTTDVVTPVITDSSTGSYSLYVPEGTYDVQVVPQSGSNFSSAIALNQAVSGDTTLNFVLVTSGSAVLSGHVYDQSHHALANQRVILQNTSGIQVNATTDDNGFYQIQANNGIYMIQLTYPSGGNDFSTTVPERYTLSIPNYSLTQSVMNDFTIPAKRVNVHVQDSSNNPVYNAQIQVPSVSVRNQPVGGTLLASGTDDYGFGGFPKPTTDQNGNVTLWLLANTSSNPYSIVVTPPIDSNSGSTTSSGIIITDDTQLTITLPPTYTVSGHVYDALGHGLNSQKVLFTQGSATIPATTDFDGSYSLHAAAGIYTIQVTYPSSGNNFSTTAPERYTLNVPNYSLTQDVNNLDLTIPAKRVDLHVQDFSGNPVYNTSIQVPTVNVSNQTVGANLVASGNNDYGVGGYPKPTTDQNGNLTLWLLTNTSNSPYTFTITPPTGSNYAPTSVSNIVITGNTQQTITLQQPVTLQGYLYDESEHGISGQSIFLESSSNQIQATTGDDGSYSLNANTGAYSFNVQYSGNSFTVNAPERYRLTSPNFSLAQTLNNFNITLPVKKITLHVQDSIGNPIRDVKAQVPTVNLTNLSIGNGLIAAGFSDYGVGGFPQPQTDDLGNIILWLFPNDTNHYYSINLTPPGGSAYSPFTVSNLLIQNDQTEIVSLQYNHAGPTTTIAFSPDPDGQGNYADPTTVTLSATAASGYTIANTYYTLDGGGQQTYSAPFTVTGGGSHTITYWSVDNSGVPEATNTKQFTIYTNQAPHITALANTTLNEGDIYTANGSFADADSSSWTATVDYGDGSGVQPLPLSGTNFSLNHTYQDNGTFPVTIVVTDNQNASSTATATITVTNVAPTVGAIDAPITAVQPNTPVNVDVNFSDPGVLDTHTATWNWGDGSALENGTVTETNGSGSIADTHIYTSSGTYTITVTVTDKDGGSSLSTAQVVVNTPPVASAGGPYITNEGDVLVLSGSGSDEDGDALIYKWDLNNDGIYDTTGTSTIYSAVDGSATQPVTFQVCDSVGFCATDSTTITVNNVAPTVGTITAPTAPVQVNTAISASATFTDPGMLDAHTALWNWGDGSAAQNGTITENNGNGSVADAHTYTSPGIYTITLTVTDKDGGVGQKSFIYVVVYDPTSGWVSGSKDYTSPAGAVVGNSGATGTASFGFQVKYQNGSMVPSGKNVVVNFPAGNIAFSSTGYEWLVVNGSTATFKADGIFNGVSGYTALVSAVDTGNGNPTGLIRFQITDNLGNIVYDTQPGAGNTANPTTSVTKGQIAVH